MRIAAGTCFSVSTNTGAAVPMGEAASKRSLKIELRRRMLVAI